METIKDLFIIGPGPSSSHTIGPNKAAKDFIKDLNKSEIDKIEVTLYGSLALTGKGHLTDKTISDVLKDFKHEIIFNYELKDLPHPNTLKFVAYINNKIVKTMTYYSVGGGKIVTDLNKMETHEVYKENSFDSIKKYLNDNKLSLIDYVNKFEDKDLDSYLDKVVDKMFDSVELNLKIEGIIPGNLKLQRVAKTIFDNATKLDKPDEKYSMLITSFAYAAVEGNASGEIVCTGPTCGSSGIIPAIIYYEYKYNHASKKKIIDSLKVAGIFGNLCKKNASISGAVLGCQAEVGVASSMASAALCYIRDLNLYQIEYASEVALEHFLGLTCDPVEGYVQIPCIERNGIGALRSYNSYLYAKNIAPYRHNRVSFDDVVEAMKMTGESLNSDYKETSGGGLAKVIK
jgi:L-serine dehydratase